MTQSRHDRKRCFRALLALTMALAMLWSLLVTAFADPEEGYGTGYIPVEKKLNPMPAQGQLLWADPSAGALPEKYRSDQQPWARDIPMKDQERSNMCWAFSMTTAAEYSWAKEQYETQLAVLGTVTDLATFTELSPGHMAYFHYNRVNDPLGNTAGDFCHPPAGSGNTWVEYGGNGCYAIQTLAAFSGFAAESLTPFEPINDNIVANNGKFVWDEEKDGPFYDPAYAYDDAVLLEESIICNLSENADGSMSESKIQTLKSMVYQYGAVSISVEMSSNLYSALDRTAYYCYKQHPAQNHAVTIVGWDDSYPATNFIHARAENGDWLKDASGATLTDLKAEQLTTPPGNGAFIIQNSWGDSIHENGFFYLSYYSRDLANDLQYAFNMQSVDTYHYNFQYDGCCIANDATDAGFENYRAETGAKAANVYVNTTGSPITLNAVGFTEFNFGTANYTIDVYTGLQEGDDPTGGIHAGTTQTVTTTAGTKTAVLDEPAVIGPGERFAIVFSFTDPKSAFGLETSLEARYYVFVAETAPGQSLYLGANAATWTDMNDINACFRIKGLANDVSTAEAQYTVAFVDGQGNTLGTRKVAHGQAAAAPATPEREGYAFDRWDTDYSAVTQNTVVTALWNVVYDAGGDTAYTKGDGEGLTLTSDAAPEKFVCVKVDGQVVDASCYSVAANGSITFTPAFLATLSRGEHTFEIVSTDGSATAVVTVTPYQSNGKFLGEEGASSAEQSNAAAGTAAVTPAATPNGISGGGQAGSTAGQSGSGETPQTAENTTPAQDTEETKSEETKPAETQSQEAETEESAEPVPAAKSIPTAAIAAIGAGTVVIIAAAAYFIRKRKV